MTSNDQSQGGNYPFMKMPRREVSTSDFEEKCKDLIRLILQVYDFFMWYGSLDKGQRDELRSILFLEGLFLQMLLSIKDICLMRGKKLCYEFSDKFKELLVQINKRMRKGTQYIRKSNQCLMEELKSETSHVTAMRKDVVEGFRNLSGWLHSELAQPPNKQFAEKLVDESDLLYDMRLYGCIGDSFEQHTNMVMNGLMLLACSSMPDTQSGDYRALFDNSIAELHGNRSWKNAMDSWKRRITKAYDLRDIVEDKDKVVFLKKIWAELDRKEQELLDRFGIDAENTRYESERATMGFRIYRNLNMDEQEGFPRMEITDLQQYLLFVIQKQYLDDEIARLKPTPVVKTIQKPANEKKKSRRLFKQNVDLKHLKACMNEVYCSFCLVDDKDKFKLEGKHNDPLTIMVYLYIICAMEGYFENADKGPFYKFCTEEVGFEAEKTDRTFRNRFDQLQDVYRKYYLKSRNQLEEETENDFQKVLRIFRGKINYDKLRRNMKG